MNDEWEKWPAVVSEKNEKFEKQKYKLKQQAKVLDKIVNSTFENGIELTKSEANDLFDDYSSEEDKDLFYDSKMDRNIKSHSDTELDSENIPFYFKSSLFTTEDKNRFDPKEDNDRYLIHSNFTNEYDSKHILPKALSESPKNVEKEESKENHHKMVLSQDMLQKLDEQNKHNLSSNDLTVHGPMMSTSSSLSLAKTIKPKKTAKMAPNRKYLVEMKPITVILAWTDKDSDQGYVKSQVILSQDKPCHKDEVKTPSSNSKTAKILEAWGDFSSSKETLIQTQTRVRDKRTMSIEDATCNPDPSVVKDQPKGEALAEQLEEKKSEGKNSLRRSLEYIDHSFKETALLDEWGLQVVMQSIFLENKHLFKKSQSNRIIKIDISSRKLAEYLEKSSAQIRGWRICEWTYEGTVIDHFGSKSHKKIRDELGLKEKEDLSISPLILWSSPGSIDDSLAKLRENAMKIKYRKIKQQMINKGVSHEVASQVGKDITTASNKKKMQILSIELESKINPTITDYHSLETKLNSLISIISRKRQEELHLLRKLKIIPWVTEILKRISVCPRNEIKDLVRIIEPVIKILLIFVSTRENRDYMLSTNRVIILTDLLIWMINKPMHMFFGCNFIPQLFEVITICLKHKAPYGHIQMKALLIDLILCSPILRRLKSKFESVMGPLHLTGKLSLIPAIIWKGLSFLEVITSIVGMDSRYRPVYEKSHTIDDSMHFIIEKTRMMHVIPLMMDALFEKAQHPKEMLPKSILNLTFLSLKVLNNMFRINLELCQKLLSDQILQDQFYYVLNFIVKYCYLFEDQDESKDILYQTLLMIGYYTLMNKQGQEKIRSGEHSLLLKLCQLDISFILEKQKKDILFPTLIWLSYKNDINLEIIDKEMDKDYLKKYIKNTKKEELYNIPEDELEQRSMDSSSICSHSISSTNSSTTSITTNLKMEHCPFVSFHMRFPKALIDEALGFIW